MRHNEENLTLLFRVMKRENPNVSRRFILSATAWQTSAEVDAESRFRLMLRPSIRVTDTSMGFLYFAACSVVKKERLYCICRE